MTEEKFVEVAHQEVKVGDTVRATFHSGDVFKGKVQQVGSQPRGVEFWFENVIFQSIWLEKIERLVPPFEPTWGMVIGDPEDSYYRLAYIPSHSHDLAPWHGNNPEASLHWYSHASVRELMDKHGWVVIEKPEGVK